MYDILILWFKRCWVTKLMRNVVETLIFRGFPVVHNCHLSV